MSNNLFIENHNHHDVDCVDETLPTIIKFYNSPLVLYHHHDEYKSTIPLDTITSSSSSLSPSTGEGKNSRTCQWEEFIVHLSRWNIVKKHSIYLILLLLVHYVVLSSFNWSIIEYTSPRFILIGSCWLYWFYSILSSTTAESIVAMKGKGIQLEKTSFLGFKTHQVFIPLENIKHVLIAEGFHIDSVIYYLAIILKQAHKNKMVIVPFEMFNPRLNLLRKVYPKLKRVLL